MSGKDIQHFPRTRRMLNKPPALLAGTLTIYLNFLFQVSNHFITKQTRDSSPENEIAQSQESSCSKLF